MKKPTIGKKISSGTVTFRHTKPITSSTVTITKTKKEFEKDAIEGTRLANPGEHIKLMRAINTALKSELNTWQGQIGKALDAAVEKAMSQTKTHAATKGTLRAIAMLAVAKDAAGLFGGAAIALAGSPQVAVVLALAKITEVTVKEFDSTPARKNVQSSKYKRVRDLFMKGVFSTVRSFQNEDAGRVITDGIAQFVYDEKIQFLDEVACESWSSVFISELGIFNLNLSDLEAQIEKIILPVFKNIGDILMVTFRKHNVIDKLAGKKKPHSLYTSCLHVPENFPAAHPGTPRKTKGLRRDNSPRKGWRYAKEEEVWNIMGKSWNFHIRRDNYLMGGGGFFHSDTVMEIWPKPSQEKKLTAPKPGRIVHNIFYGKNLKKVHEETLKKLKSGRKNVGKKKKLKDPLFR